MPRAGQHQHTVSRAQFGESKTPSGPKHLERAKTEALCGFWWRLTDTLSRHEITPSYLYSVHEKHTQTEVYRQTS